jgi:ADP-heptose:LPS heptosyltransferase
MRPPLNPTEKPNPDLSGIKKVILIRLRRIGDIVMTTPAITALRKGLPSAHISYVVEMLYRELIEGNPHLDKAIVLPRPLGAKNFWNTVRKIGYKIKYKSFVYDFKLPRGIKTGHLHSVENHINLVKALGLRFRSLLLCCCPNPRSQKKRKFISFSLTTTARDPKSLFSISGQEMNFGSGESATG